MGKLPAPMTADYAAELNTSLVWVIADPAVLAVLVTKACEDHLLLDTIAVSPQAQGKGYAAELLSRAEADAREVGVPEVRLYTNEAMTENFDFYRKHGYTETARGDHEGYRRVFFSKRVELVTSESPVRSER